MNLIEWTTAQLVRELLPFFACFGWTLDMLAAELGMLLLVITTWEVEWYFFLYYFPVYCFLLIVAPSWSLEVSESFVRYQTFLYQEKSGSSISSNAISIEITQSRV